MATIMIVEDNTEYAQRLKRELERRYRRYIVEVRQSPREALAAFDVSPWEFDLLVIDMRFDNAPEQGTWLVRKLSERRAATRSYSARPRLVCLSADPDQRTEQNLNIVEPEGARFLEKTDAMGFLMHLDKELSDLQQHDRGPQIEIQHTVVTTSTDTLSDYRCRAGERIIGAEIIDEHSNARFRIDVRPRQLLYFDLLASKQHGLFVDEIISHLSADKFYRQQLGMKLSDAKHPEKTVMMNIRRLHEGLERAIKDSKLPYLESKILQEEYWVRRSGEQLLDTVVIEAIKLRNRGRKIATGSRLPGVKIRYKLQARIRLRHHD
jgi:CheY-like chemotaxis protein